MKKKVGYLVGILLILTLILVFIFRDSIFQCGNPIPYIKKIVTLNEDKKFAKVYKDKDKEIYITKKEDYEDLHKYIEDKYKVSFLEQIGSGFIFVSHNKNITLTGEVYLKNYQVWKLKIKEEKLDLNYLSIEQLTKIRDKAIDKNLEGISEFGKETVEGCKDGILNYDWGLVSYINNSYKNLSEKDKLIRQIKIIEYENSIDEIMDPSGAFFKYANEAYEISEYLAENKRNINISSYENLKFLIDNLEELCDYVDYELIDLFDMIDPASKENLSQNEKEDLYNRLEKINDNESVSVKVKNGIQYIMQHKS